VSRPPHRSGTLRPEPLPAPPPAPPLLLDHWLNSTRHLVLVSTTLQKAWTAKELPADYETRAAVNWLLEPSPYMKCICPDFRFCTCDTTIFETWEAFVINSPGSKYVYGGFTVHLGEPPDFVDAAIRRAIEQDPC
jgi:hypothetical protein